MKIVQKVLKLTSFLQQLKLSDANIVFYDVQHKHLCLNLIKSSLGFHDPLNNPGKSLSKSIRVWKDC